MTRCNTAPSGELKVTTIYLPNGDVALMRVDAVHGRLPGSLKTYARPTEWLASAGYELAWGRTRREAVAGLMRKMSATAGRALPDNVVRLKR